MVESQVQSTKDLMKKRLAETKNADLKTTPVSPRQSTPLRRALLREKNTPTKLLVFSCDSSDQEKYVKTRNISHNRSQIFYANRQDFWAEQAKCLKSTSRNVSQVRLSHNVHGDAEEAALARGRLQLNHMRQAQACTFNKDNPVKFAKRIVSPMKTVNGVVQNKAAGHNDIGQMIKAQFDPQLRSLSNAFEQEQQARENRFGKRVIKCAAEVEEK